MGLIIGEAPAASGQPWPSRPLTTHPTCSVLSAPLSLSFPFLQHRSLKSYHQHRVRSLPGLFSWFFFGVEVGEKVDEVEEEVEVERSFAAG